MTLTAACALARVVTVVALRNVPVSVTEPATKVPLSPTCVTAAFTSVGLITVLSFEVIVTVPASALAVYKALKVESFPNAVARLVATAAAVNAAPVRVPSTL